MKKNVVVIFGGDSSEHDVSCLSATTVIKNMDTEKYNVILVGITKEGKWLLVDGVKDIEDGSWREGEVKAFISPDTTTRSLVILAEGTYKLQKVDVIFPVLHGMNGEDGTVQGLFELSKIPYVGCGVLASAVSMDKVYTKIIVDHIGIDQAKFVHVRESDFEHLEEAMDRVEKEIPYPIFVKPSCAGSSKGVSKAENRKELEAALYEAVKHDRNILCEETIVGREVECAVLGDRTQVKSTCVGEILAAEEAAFYDFDAKYNNAESKTVVDPEMPEESKRKIKEDAEAIFRAVDGFGLSRVDFFLEESGRVVFNEINTLPGFTSISMYPIGVFDSGVGGLTVAREIMRQLPEESMIYFGDTARVPYGTKSKDTIVRYSRQIVNFLLSKGVKAVVIACNTASALALADLQELYNVPIIGMVQPGAIAAMNATKNKNIGIIGTNATIKSGQYGQYLRKLDPSVTVVTKACPLFVPLVEEGLIDDRITEDMVSRYLREFKQYDIDSLILGCTHYPLLINPIQRFVGDKVTLVNPAYEVAKTLKQMLAQRDMAASEDHTAKYEYYVSDMADQFLSFADKVLPCRVDQVQPVDIENY